MAGLTARTRSRSLTQAIGRLALRGCLAGFRVTAFAGEHRRCRGDELRGAPSTRGDPHRPARGWSLDSPRTAR
jgi:hypothetical protein